ncbi:AAA family ATPase [Bradyrhizobium sp. 180]|uniref:AAA family ATPase n=1 Tax=Bradyrhizobium sp. 180 TaxID=2782650 RepID=UPI001FF97C6A|nr:AAA family ATPase [Bradyrhizobium sp. 180]MCK1493276.1 AAA family ATPase [Bradyrhizobium sp. 180]
MTVPTQIRGAVRSVTRNSDSHAAGLSVQWLGDPSSAPRKEWVIRGVLGAGEVMVIHADTKVGKTQLATHISFAVATGGEIFGRPVARAAVLYGAFEKAPVTKKRFRALQRIHENVEPPIAVCSGPINLANAEDAKKIIDTAKEMSSTLPVKLIVVDTLNRASGGVDENAAGPMGLIFNQLSRIAEEVGAGVIVLHHNTQGKTKMRGSSAVPASADVLMSLEKRSDDIREAKITAANDIPEGQSFRFRLRQVEITPRTADADAEHTVVMDAIGSDQKGDAVASQAVLNRAAELLQLFDRLNEAGRFGRAALLSAARDHQIVSEGKSGSEQLRVTLKELKRQGRLDYSHQDIWSLQTGPMSNVPISSLKEGDFGPMDLDQ